MIRTRENCSVTFAVLASLLSSLLVTVFPQEALAATCTIGSDQKNSAIGVNGNSTNSGSESNPFPISTASDLTNLDACIDTSKTNGVYYKLTQDIDFSASGLTRPLGEDNKAFQGNLDGSKSGGVHSIFNISVSSSVETGGLFYELASATVENLLLKGSVRVERAAAVYAGGLAGQAVTSLVKNVRTEVDLGVTATAVVYAGGIVGGYGASTFSSISVAIGPEHGSVHAQGSSVRIGGIAGVTWQVGSSRFENLWITAPITARATGFSVHAGGVIGSANLSGLAAFATLTDLENIRVNSTIHVLQVSNDSIVGGLLGDVSELTAQINQSEFSGLLMVPNSTANYVGGLVGAAIDSDGARLSISNSVNNGALRSNGVNPPFAGGVFGTITAGSGKSANATLSNVLVNPVSIRLSSGSSYGVGRVSSNGFRSISNTVVNNEAFPSNNEFFATTLNNLQLSDPSSVPFDSYSTARFDDSFVWNQCTIPYLTSLGNSGCFPQVVGAVIQPGGQEMSIYFSQALSTASAPASAFEIMDSQLQTIGVTQASWNSGGRTLSLSLSKTVLAAEVISLEIATPSLLRAFSSSDEATAFDNFYVANTSTVTGPVVQNVASSNLTPTSVDLSFGCGGSCDPSASFDYVASITPAGGSATTRTGTTYGTATLSFNNLTPNVAHAISVTVTQGGLTSPAATLNVTTPKPIATISALTVADVSATLTVGCTNCGAAPDSFVITATPQAGGAAITSTTNVVSGLTSETTYSFAVVVRFAGVDSDSVNWQSNPVMTLPFVPIISSVSPAALPISGGTVTVTGSNFSTSNEVALDGATVSFTIVSGTTITFTAPQKTAGEYAISITNLVGSNTLANAIRFVSGPSLSTNSPLVGTANGGTIVTLTGTDLGTASKLELGLATVSFSVLSETAIRFVTPDFNSVDISGSPVLNIKVTTVGGTATLTNGFEYTTSALVPLVSAITPSNGPFGGGTVITVTGQYFSGSYSDSVSAAINGISGSSIVLIDDSTLTFVSPPGAADTGLDVTVATGGGLGTLSGAFSYTAPPAPTTPGAAPSVAITTPMIVEFSTREIAASGAQVTATGQRLEGISVLTLGGMTLTIVSNTATSITFTTGEMPLGVWDLRLVGANGTLVFQNAIEVVGVTIVTQSTGELLGYTWTLRFRGNSRSLHQAQEAHLNRRMTANSQAETIICWGYTTSSSPNAWAIAHATQRAQAACDMALANNPAVKTVVRLRFGVEKSWAMRSAVQFWR